MTDRQRKQTVSITLDSDVLDSLRQIVESGASSSLSAVIYETLRDRLGRGQEARRARASVEEHLLDGAGLTERPTRLAPPPAVMSERPPRDRCVATCR